MTGRDPHEHHRAATPLELLYDLTFVVAFGAAGNELAHALAEDHLRSGLVSFGFCVFAICWAWINFTWFASAYDTDDWAFRLLTMVQMAGVIILATGVPEVFASVHEGRELDNTVVVAGYVVMRVSMVGLWMRAARQDPERRRPAKIYVVSILVSQVLWCLLLVPDIGINTTFALALIPYAIELTGPVVAELRFGGTPWHPRHIAERTACSPSSRSARRSSARSHSVGMRATDPFHLMLLAGTTLVLISAVLLASGGASLAVCLVVVALAPLVTVVGYEVVGQAHAGSPGASPQLTR